MKKALLVLAAAGAAAFANTKIKQRKTGKELWAQASDKPGEKVISGNTSTAS
ncbi:DLW-39 family protein [Luteipulveratus sp. YIM 133132]|uniref:DLW-39 family protein n=1 Tax=Luteipulveratus flavus TaxID=3031728 RepID=A0ABT6C4L8_9MICO|nr:MULTISPECIES: DLW-39 family protein [unclassified Luteipulveratus]MDE9365394.1 DLW-39 family protein [Luteipulveratus sp. YIM 133132]MDF8263896.1 DLW-39 family protein [Luteipulveratus sp. YIM 133296]